MVYREILKITVKKIMRQIQLEKQRDDKLKKDPKRYSASEYSKDD